MLWVEYTNVNLDHIYMSPVGYTHALIYHKTKNDTIDVLFDYQQSYDVLIKEYDNGYGLAETLLIMNNNEYHNEPELLTNVYDIVRFYNVVA